MKKFPDIISFRGEYFFLSNFYPTKMEYDGILWASSEHAYQAAKTLNTEEKQAILLSATPREAKQLGKIVSLRSDWAKVKIKIMEDIVRIKFQNPELRDLLLQTGQSKLYEGNWWNDTFWGVDISTKRGYNWLGKILMMLRFELMDES